MKLSKMMSSFSILGVLFLVLPISVKAENLPNSSKIRSEYQTGIEGFSAYIDYAAMDEETKIKLNEFVESQGSKVIEENIENYVEEYVVSDALKENEKTLEEIVDDIVVPEGDLRKRRAVKSGYDYANDEFYHLEKFNKGWTIEYLSVLEMEVYLKNGKINNVTSTSFDIESMSAGGDYSNVKTSTYIRNDGLVAGMNVNYKIQKEIEFPISDFSIPLVYEKSSHDYITYYVK